MMKMEAGLKKHFWDYAFLVLISGVIIVLDQWTKWWVRTNLSFQESWAPWPWLYPYARVVHWRNTGVAFGMFQNLGDVFLVLSALVSLGILYFFPRVPRRDTYLRFALALQLGGAVGNLIDRISRGYVTDFISIGKFAVFNVADSSISIGVAILLIGLWIKEMQSKAQASQEGSKSPQETASRLPEDLE